MSAIFTKKEVILLYTEANNLIIYCLFAKDIFIIISLFCDYLAKNKSSDLIFQKWILFCLCMIFLKVCFIFLLSIYWKSPMSSWLCKLIWVTHAPGKEKKNPDDCIVRFWSRVCSFNALSLYLESTLMTLILQGIFIVALSLRILLVCRYITLVYWVKVSISVLDLQLKMLCKFQSYHDPQEFLCNGQLKNDCFKS